MICAIIIIENKIPQGQGVGLKYEHILVECSKEQVNFHTDCKLHSKENGRVAEAQTYNVQWIINNVIHSVNISCLIIGT